MSNETSKDAILESSVTTAESNSDSHCEVCLGRLPSGCVCLNPTDRTAQALNEARLDSPNYTPRKQCSSRYVFNGHNTPCVLAEGHKGLHKGEYGAPWIGDGEEGKVPIDFKLQAEDPINPSHYKQGSIECIDAIEAALSPEEFIGFLRGQVMQYLWRYRHKGRLEDLKKGMWYFERLVRFLERHASSL